MAVATTTIPATELKPGTYFKQGARWFRTVSAPVFPAGGDFCQIEYVEPTTGGRSWVHVYSEDVTVTVDNAVPATFQSNALLRKAKAAHAKALELLKTKEQLERLAVE